MSVHLGLGFESVKLVSAGGLAVLGEQSFGKLGEVERSPWVLGFDIRLVFFGEKEERSFGILVEVAHIL